eukprot:scaffold331068_cov30-Attheya_sp.AAC.1
MNTILSLNENIHFVDCTKSSRSSVQIGNSNGDIFSQFTAMDIDIPHSKVDNNWTSLSKVFILREYLKSHGEGKGDRFVKQLFEPTLKANLIQAVHFHLYYLALTPFTWIIPPQSFLDAHSGCSIESRQNRFASLLHASLKKLFLKTLDSLDAKHCPLKVNTSRHHSERRIEHIRNDKLQSAPSGNTVVECEVQKQSTDVSLIEKDGSELQISNEADRTFVVTSASTSKKSKKKKKKKKRKVPATLVAGSMGKSTQIQDQDKTEHFEERSIRRVDTADTVTRNNEVKASSVKFSKRIESVNSKEDEAKTEKL